MDIARSALLGDARLISLPFFLFHMHCLANFANYHQSNIIIQGIIHLRSNLDVHEKAEKSDGIAEAQTPWMLRFALLFMYCL